MILFLRVGETPATRETPESAETPAAAVHQEVSMTRGTRYLGLLANLRQDEMLYEARRRTHSTEPIRPRDDRSFGASLLRALRITKR